MAINRRFFQNPCPKDDNFLLTPTQIRGHIYTYIQNILERFKPEVGNCDGGLYVGLPGVAFMLYKLLSHEITTKSKLFSEDEETLYHDYMLKYLEISLKNMEKYKTESNFGFLLGNAGINVLSTVLYLYLSKTGDKLSTFSPDIGKYFVLTSQNTFDLFVSAASIGYPINFLKCGGDELFVGRAGYLNAIYFLEKELPYLKIDDGIKRTLIQSMLESGSKLAQQSTKPNKKFPLMYSYYGTKYLGAGHGISSILLQMLNYKEILETIPQGLELVRASCDALLSYQWANGNFAPTLDEVGEEPSLNNELMHWCHGAPGIIYLMAKAFLVFGDQKYLDCAKACGECIWERGLLRKGPGLCHGIAGNAYAFLLLYRLSACQDVKWVHRAHRFAQFMFSDMFQHESRVPDSPFSLYEGLAGTVCFLVDLLYPEKAAFPFYDIF